MPAHQLTQRELQREHGSSGGGDGALTELTVEPLPKWLQATSLFSYGETVHAVPFGTAAEINCPQRLNDARYLNKFIEAVNTRLMMGGAFKGNAETQEQRKRRILDKFPRWFAWPYYCVDFVFKRIFPKLPVTKQIYFALTQGRNRVLSKAEILGRLSSCGFEIMDVCEVDDKLHFTVRKVGPPLYPERPTYGPIVRLRRFGKGGDVIHVYKLRTMHPFAEYLQEYIHKQNGLAEGGKLKNDIRVTYWGRFLRRYWLDELPMLVNWIKGELQLVGPRPLSGHYLALYPDDLVEWRLKHKPGIVPPFYADLPKTFEEIVASERRYLEAYELSPLKTNTRYFFRAVSNILFKGARSQ